MDLNRMIRGAISVIKKKFHKKYTQITIPTNNYKLKIPGDLVWAFADGDYYEQNVIHFLDRIVKSYHDPVMIDIGANCGYYSIRYSSLCRQIFSFEPVSTTYRILKKNIERNAIHNVITFKSGLSDKPGQQLINLYNSSANNSMFERSIPEEHPLKKIGTEIIKLDNLDELIECGKVAIPNIIKIDVEGAELQVLKGAQKTILKYRPTILFEYAQSTSMDAGYLKEELLTILNLNGYKVYGIPEDEKDFNLVQEKDFEKNQVANLIFSPVEFDLLSYGTD